jgi:hypothetical protein
MFSSMGMSLDVSSYRAPERKLTAKTQVQRVQPAAKKRTSRFNLSSSTAQGKGTVADVGWFPADDMEIDDDLESLDN